MGFLCLSSRIVVPNSLLTFGGHSKGVLVQRALLLEDYVKLLSKPQFYITHNHWSYPMRTLKWDPLFDPEEETTTAIAWISFPSLPPNFFGKETIFSMAAVVGRPLQVDLGHNEKDCYVIHPELFLQDEQIEEKEQKQDNKENKGERDNQADGKCANGKKQEHGDRVQEDKERNTNFREQRRRYGYENGYQIQNKMTTQVWNVRTSQVNAKVTTKNKFGALEGEDDKQDTFTHQVDEGNKSLLAQQKEVTQQEGNRRESAIWSSNFHIKENKMGLEQIDSLENPIEKDTGSNGTQLEANKAMIDKERERGKINALELQKEDDLARRGADSFSTPNIEKKMAQEIQKKLDTEEEESMDANIPCISREGDLSPRHIGHLKG
ncbi:hypothetical protein MTR67_047904 [Solanum verrucosum]|uniref:DUF4283 domain-containing protein n=1 Tax=Solanum verrucosum TaxID=315347 RepID=A0AAF0UZC9_SOLVR|nr:hypothetical protein MTR67_047904 [Solanum verrucosum]